MIKKVINKGINILKYQGIKGLCKKITSNSFRLKIAYSSWLKKQRVSKEELQRQRSFNFKYQPKISIIVPTYNTPLNLLDDMINSVLDQSYTNFELCIGDGSEKNYQENLKKYTDPRIKIIYLTENKGISGNTNEALKLATGDYIALFDHDDVLELDALFEVVKSLQDNEYDIIYTDEDKLNYKGTKYCDPCFKPDYSPELFTSYNYINHLFVVKKEIVDRVGLFNFEYDGAQDYDFMFRCIEEAKTIKHISKILYHWRMGENSTASNPESKLYAFEAGKKAIQAHYKRLNIEASVEMGDILGTYKTKYNLLSNPLVSIIIPNKDSKDLLSQCIESLYKVNSYQNIEVIVVENNSTTKAIFDYYEEIQLKYPNLKVIKWDQEFNFSKINNFGVLHTNGDYLLFLNNDTRVINSEAIKQLVGNCLKDHVGVVGPKLLFEDNTIQHAGVVIGIGDYAGHIYSGENQDFKGHLLRAKITNNYSAVTGACLMVKKNLFEKVGGFDERFKVACNDVDLCLKIRQMGMYVVYEPMSLWYHFESKTRGSDLSPENRQRFDEEIKLFKEKWEKYYQKGDPFYNTYLRG